MTKREREIDYRGSYNIASRDAQSNSLYVSVLKIPIVHVDSVSKSLQFARISFFARVAMSARGKISVIFRDNNGYKQRLGQHQSQNEDNFAAFSLGLDFLNKAEKEKNNGKGDSVSAPSRFASLSEGEMQQILTERHSGKTKQMTNWSVK